MVDNKDHPTNIVRPDTGLVPEEPTNILDEIRVAEDFNGPVARTDVATPHKIIDTDFTAGLEVGGDEKAAQTKKLSATWDTKIAVVRVEVKRIEVRAVAELKRLAGIEKLPLSKMRMAIELKGVSLGFASALRRTMIDEMKGRCLSVGKALGSSGTTDPFMFDQFVVDRIMQIPLRPQISKEVIKDLRLAVHIENKTASDMTVYSGDMQIVKGVLSEPIFNPTFEIGFVQPGHSLHIEEIYISEGYGRDFGGYQVGCCGASKPLDLEQHPRELTHAMDAPYADESGYKLSSMLVNPRHHEVSVVIPAVGINPGEAISVAVDACINIKERLRLVQNTLETEVPGAGRQKAGKQWGGGGIQFTLIELEAGLTQGILWIGGETHTIGNMLARQIFDHTPEISYVGYTCIRHENGVRLTVRHTEKVPDMILRAVRTAYDTMDIIQKGITGASVVGLERASSAREAAKHVR